MGVQSGINRLIGAASFGAAAVSRMAASLKEAAAKANTAAMEKAKQGYEKSASIKAENTNIKKSYNDSAVPEKVKQPEVLESSMKPAVYDKLLPQPKQKFILDENIGEPVSVKNSKTNIEIDDDVKGLLKIKRIAAEKNGLINEEYDASAELERIKQKQKNSERGRKAWETRVQNVNKFSDLNSMEKRGLSFSELEKREKKRFEEFSPLTMDEAKQLGIGKDRLRYWSGQAETGNPELFAGIFKDLKEKFKNDPDAMAYLNDQWDSKFALFEDGTLDDTKLDINAEIGDVAKTLLSGKYKEMYNPDIQAQKELEYYENAEERQKENDVRAKMEAEWNAFLEKSKNTPEEEPKWNITKELSDEEYNKLAQEVREKDTFKGYHIGAPLNTIGAFGATDRSKLDFRLSNISDEEKAKLQEEYSNFEEIGRRNHWRATQANKAKEAETKYSVWDDSIDLSKVDRNSFVF